MTQEKSDIQEFWDAVYDTAYREADASLDRETLIERLDRLEDMFRYRSHLAVTEVDLANLTGKRFLEVGSGAGGHSALFAGHGADVTSIDLTFSRVSATAAKLRLLEGDGRSSDALQADAEALPFASGSFDIVYSNGVLHHTHDTEAAIAELYRVLRPGGQAVVMLYCKSSFHYWVTLWFCVGLLKGEMFRSRSWLGRNTEWIGRTPQTATNPITRCYTGREITRLFKNFEGITRRKSEFDIRFIPKFGRLYERWQLKRFGSHQGGVIVYGAPWPIASPMEIRLGKAIGWAWNIRARKPAHA